MVGFVVAAMEVSSSFLSFFFSFFFFFAMVCGSGFVLAECLAMGVVLVMGHEFG